MGHQQGATAQEPEESGAPPLTERVRPPLVSSIFPGAILGWHAVAEMFDEVISGSPSNIRLDPQQGTWPTAFEWRLYCGVWRPTRRPQAARACAWSGNGSPPIACWACSKAPAFPRPQPGNLPRPVQFQGLQGCSHPARCPVGVDVASLGMEASPAGPPEALPRLPETKGP